MAPVEPQPAADLAMHPSPVLLEAVLKVEQVVARLQNLQSTISGIHLSPVNAKHTRPYRPNATSRGLSSKDFAAGKENSRPAHRRDEDRRKSFKHHNADSKPAHRETPKKSKGEWKQWSSPANQVHDVISEILMASEYAKQIATLVAEALQDGPLKTKEPAPQAQEPKKRVCKDGKRRDIAFPSMAQVQKTMSGKGLASKPVNKFKVIFPSDGTVRLGAAPKLSRTLSPRLGVQSPEKKRAREKLFPSPNGSFRESDYADDELSGPRRLSMNVTEIRGSLKPWKLTPTKGVLFSNPVYMASSPMKAPAVKIVPGKNESMRRRSAAAAHSLSSSISTVSFKRDAATKAAAALKPDLSTGSTRREHRSRKSVPSRYVEMVPLDGPRNSSILTMLDVLNVRSPSRHESRSNHSAARRLQPLDANSVDFTDKPAAGAERTKESAEDAQCRVSHSRCTKVTPNVESLVNGPEKPAARAKQGVPSSLPADSESEKENTPIPRCAPAAVKELFLRSMSNGHALNRTLSRKNSGVSLLKRAKGWMSSQHVKQGRVHELER